MDTNTRIITAGRIVNIGAVIAHIVIFVLGFYYPVPLFGINLLMHASWLYGSFKTKMVFMLVPVCLWIFTASFSIYVMCFIAHPNTDEYVTFISSIIILIIFYVISLLATNSTRKLILRNRPTEGHVGAPIVEPKETY